jgi:hypothetical protein
MAKNYQSSVTAFVVCFAAPTSSPRCHPQGKREVMKRWIFLAVLAVIAWKFATVLDLERLVYSTPGTTSNAN